MSSLFAKNSNSDRKKSNFAADYHKVALVWDELFNWHSGYDASFEQWTQPGVKYWENAESKRRIFTLIKTLIGNKLTYLDARDASEEELKLFHTTEYIERVKEISSGSVGFGDLGECARAGAQAFRVAVRGAGGVLAACEAVMRGEVRRAYALVRPPGHHSLPDKGAGFCIFNNVVVAAKALLTSGAVSRIAIVDFDVHHGNGTQHAFWDDSNVLFVSVHQSSNYPHNSGRYDETGGPSAGQGATINVPLPPGSGHGAYMYTFDKIVSRALARFRPEIILVSSGFDGSFADPLGSMMLHSETYGGITEMLCKAADDLCQGKIVFAHEGGYSEDYVPWCGLAVLDKMLCTGATATTVLLEDHTDPYLSEAKGWGYQGLQRNQWLVVNAVHKMHRRPPASLFYYDDELEMPAEVRIEANPLEAYVSATQTLKGS